MTGDETNLPMQYFPNDSELPKQNGSEPVASKAGEESELKPCPFCGKPGKEWMDRGAKVYGCSDFENCNRPRPSHELLNSWNNAWAHKQIAALEHELKIQDDANDILEARNAELKESLATEITMHSIAKDNIADLEKRNAELTPPQHSEDCCFWDKTDNYEGRPKCSCGLTSSPR